MKEVILESIRRWQAERTRRKSYARFLVLPAQDATPDRQFEIVHENDPLFSLLKGTVSNPEERIVDIPKKAIREDGSIDSYYATVVVDRRHGNKVTCIIVGKDTVTPVIDLS